jgi:hypothetical protein
VLNGVEFVNAFQRISTILFVVRRIAVKIVVLEQGVGRPIFQHPNRMQNTGSFLSKTNFQRMYFATLETIVST